MKTCESQVYNEYKLIPSQSGGRLGITALSVVNPLFLECVLTH